MKKFLILLAAVLAFAVLGAGCVKTPAPPPGGDGTSPPAEEKTGSVFPEKENVIDDGQSWTNGEINFPSSLWKTPNAERAEQYDRKDCGAEAYFLDSVLYQGRTTKVFAFVGFPSGASESKPVPGVVCVHGGGGTAFPDWVKYWNDRGYAAVSIDTEGNIPTETANVREGNVTRISPKHHGPANAQYSDMEKAVTEQWQYHASSAVIVANSFLRSFKQVRSDAVGVTGISWGSVICSITACYDGRFAFCIPVYGGLAQKGTLGIAGQIFTRFPRSAELWDGTDKLEACRTPFLFVNGNEDDYFTVAGTTAMFRAAPYAQMLIIDKMIHGHLQGIEVPDIYVFADNICFDIPSALPQIKKMPTFEDTTLEYDIKRSETITAKFFYTDETDLCKSTVWKTSALLQPQDGKFVYELPADAKNFYVEINDLTYEPGVPYRCTTPVITRS